MGTTVTVQELVDNARDLRSHDGMNLEYDRALTELVARVLGLDAEHDEIVRVAILGV